MPRLSQLLARGIAEGVALARLGTLPRRGFRVLMYHAVGTPADQDRLNLYCISKELFASHAAALAAYRGAAIVDLSKHAGTTDGMRVAVTFDDGYRDNLLQAAPILQRYGIPFTVFVCTGFVQRKDPRFLSAAEIRELAAMPGVTIGSHAVSHRRLTEMGDSEVMEELTASKRFLEDATGREVSRLSYPHGAVDRRIRDAAAAAGYTIGACSRFDINGPLRDPMLLSRTSVHGADSVRVLCQKLHGDWDWYRWRSTDPAA